MRRWQFCTINKCHVSENSQHHQESGSRDYFKKQKNFAWMFFKSFFTRDQNSNSLYLQGPKAYISLFLFINAKLEMSHINNFISLPIWLRCEPNVSRDKAHRHFKYENDWLVEQKFDPFVHQRLYSMTTPTLFIREMLAIYVLTYTFQHTIFIWLKFTWSPQNLYGTHIIWWDPYEF